MLDVLNADYIRTARAKGLPENVVINIPEYDDPAGLLYELPASEHVRRSHDHGRDLPDPGDRTDRLSGDDNGRYSVCNVLYGISDDPDADQSDHRGYHVCRSRPARAGKLMGKGDLI